MFSTPSVNRFMYIGSTCEPSGPLTQFRNVLGPTSTIINENPLAVQTVINYCRCQGLNGLVLYDANYFESGTGTTFTSNWKAKIADFVSRCSVYGIRVAIARSGSAAEINTVIDYNNTRVNANEKLWGWFLENEWWFSSTRQDLIDILADQNATRAAQQAAGLKSFVYTGNCHDAGYLYPADSGGLGPVPVNEMEELEAAFDVIGLTCYQRKPNWNRIRGRARQLTQPTEIWVMFSVEDPDYNATGSFNSGPDTYFSGYFAEGRDTNITPPPTPPVSFARKSWEDCYDYVVKTLSSPSPSQSGTPISYQAETDPNAINNAQITGYVLFEWKYVANTNSKNFAPIVFAGDDETITLPTNSVNLAGEFADDLLPGVPDTTPTTYTYAWTKVSGPAGDVIGTPNSLTTMVTFTNAGTYVYRLTVTDGGGSGLSDSDDLVVVVNSAAAALDFDIDVLKTVICNGGGDGRLQAVVTSGTGPYTYAWTGPGGFTATTALIIDLSPGTYTCVVTDTSTAEVVTKSVVLSNPLVISIVLNPTNILCFGGSNGAVACTPSGGNGAPFSFAWTGPLGFTATTQNITTLTEPGTYTVVVTDAAGCTNSASVTITEPTIQISATWLVTPVTCYGGSDGRIEITAVGGGRGGPYTYLWHDNGGTPIGSGPVITGLSAGTYGVTVTDSVGCQRSYPGTTIVVTEPAEIVPYFNFLDFKTCANEDEVFTATIEVFNTASPDFDVLGATYLWNTGETTKLISRVINGPGTYNFSVVVTLPNGCQGGVGQTVTVNQNPGLGIGITQDGPLGACPGSEADLSATGTGAYDSFEWIFPGSGLNTSPLTIDAPGTYGIYGFKTGNPCPDYAEIVVTADTAQIVIDEIIFPSLCGGGSDGAIAITISGGCGPFTAQWSTGQTGLSLVNLAAGSYTVVVTDTTTNDTATKTIVLPEPSEVSATGHVVNPSAMDSADGSIALTPIGGSGTGYSYQWSHGPTTQNVSGLLPGTYTVVVTDSSNCVGSVSFSLFAAEQPYSFGLTNTELTCFLQEAACCYADKAIEYIRAQETGATDIDCIRRRLTLLGAYIETLRTWYLSDDQVYAGEKPYYVIELNRFYGWQINISWQGTSLTGDQTFDPGTGNIGDAVDALIDAINDQTETTGIVAFQDPARRSGGRLYLFGPRTAGWNGVKPDIVISSTGIVPSGTQLYVELTTNGFQFGSDPCGMYLDVDGDPVYSPDHCLDEAQAGNLVSYIKQICGDCGCGSFEDLTNDQQ